MTFSISDEHLIPLAEGQAVSAGWTAASDRRPLAVTWHWSATWDLAACTRLLGGGAALRRGQASAHCGIGRSFAEGVHRYVALENRSWHAGKNQTLRWDGRALDDRALRGSRGAIGIETINIGYAREGVPAADDWLAADSPDGRQAMRVQPWTDEQLTMMVAVGKEILAAWPHIRPRDHHGHHDICPGYKVDVAGFPFAELLRRIYDDPSLPDVWTPLWRVRQRQRALSALGFDLGASGADGVWGRRSDAALRSLQRQAGLVEDGFWTSFVHHAAHELCERRGMELAGVTAR